MISRGVVLVRFSIHPGERRCSAAFSDYSWRSFSLFILVVLGCWCCYAHLNAGVRQFTSQHTDTDNSTNYLFGIVASIDLLPLIPIRCGYAPQIHSRILPQTPVHLLLTSHDYQRFGSLPTQGGCYNLDGERLEMCAGEKDLLPKCFDSQGGVFLHLLPAGIWDFYSDMRTGFFVVP